MAVISRPRERIIPARAGSTEDPLRGARYRRDHPRSRGEHKSKRGGFGKATGSSPLARGAQLTVAGTLPQARIIPARAGSTSCSMFGAGEPADHPRSRGEHVASHQIRRFGFGSSPLARGALSATGKPDNKNGIIPARAGSTLSLAASVATYRDHPRSRGEHRCKKCCG